MIVRADGYVVTSAHLVSPKHDRLVVELADGRTRIATVVGFDWSSDLAILRIAVAGAPSLSPFLGERPAMGTAVVAIGSPLGRPRTVTKGVVEGLGWSREGSADSELAWVLSDAATLPGVSGGPLLTENGRFVGINTLIAKEPRECGVAVSAERVAHFLEVIIDDPESGRGSNREHGDGTSPRIPREWIVEGAPLPLPWATTLRD